VKQLKNPENLVGTGRADGTQYGLGFETFKTAEGQILFGHDGTIPGCISSLALYDPETKQAASYVQVKEDLTKSMSREIVKTLGQAPEPERVAKIQRRLMHDYNPSQLALRHREIVIELSQQIMQERNVVSKEPIHVEHKQHSGLSREPANIRETVSCVFDLAISQKMQAMAKIKPSFNPGKIESKDQAPKSWVTGKYNQTTTGKPGIKEI